MKGHLGLPLLGALAGFASYLLFEYADDWERPAWIVAVAFLMISSSATGLLAHALGLSVAVVRAIALAIFLAALLHWSILRFGNDLSYHALLFTAVSTALAIPLLSGRKIPPGPEKLYQNTLEMIANGLAAFLMFLVFLAAYGIATLLLGLVGIDFLEDIAEEPVIVLPALGAVLGLGLSIASAQTQISAVGGILSRLNRPLVVPVLIILVIFLIGIAVQGFENTFVNLSAGATLMAAALGAAALGISVVDGRDDMASKSPLLIIATKLLTLILPLIVALAGLALAQRVMAYGWTPERIMSAMAMMAALILTAAHAGSVFVGEAWTRQHRHGSQVAWIGALILSLAALTPLLDPYKISAQNQLTRFQQGLTQVADLDARLIYQDWGPEGRKAHEGLSAITNHREQDKLTAALDAAKVNNDPPMIQGDFRAAFIDLLETIPKYPENAELDLTDLTSADELERNGRDLIASCNRPLGDCVQVLGDFDPGRPGNEAVILYKSSTWARAMYLVTDGRTPKLKLFRSQQRFRGIEWETTLGDLKAGRISVSPPRLNSLAVGDEKFVPLDFYK